MIRKIAIYCVILLVPILIESCVAREEGGGSTIIITPPPYERSAQDDPSVSQQVEDVESLIEKLKEQAANDDPIALYKLGLAYLKLSKPQLALAALERSKDVRIKRGMVIGTIDKYIEAARAQGATSPDADPDKDLSKQTDVQPSIRVLQTLNNTLGIHSVLFDGTPLITEDDFSRLVFLRSNIPANTVEKRQSIAQYFSIDVHTPLQLKAEFENPDMKMRIANISLYLTWQFYISLPISSQQLSDYDLQRKAFKVTDPRLGKSEPIWWEMNESDAIEIERLRDHGELELIAIAAINSNTLSDKPLSIVKLNLRKTGASALLAKVKPTGCDLLLSVADQLKINDEFYSKLKSLSRLIDNQHKHPEEYEDEAIKIFAKGERGGAAYDIAYHDLNALFLCAYLVQKERSNIGAHSNISLAIKDMTPIALNNESYRTFYIKLIEKSSTLSGFRRYLYTRDIKEMQYLGVALAEAGQWEMSQRILERAWLLARQSEDLRDIACEPDIMFCLATIHHKQAAAYEALIILSELIRRFPPSQSATTNMIPNDAIRNARPQITVNKELLRKASNNARAIMGEFERGVSKEWYGNLMNEMKQKQKLWVIDGKMDKPDFSLIWPTRNSNQ
jgi:hypothetical protein